MMAENPRLTPERAEFLVRHWGVEADDGTVERRADPAHMQVKPDIWRLDEAAACWRRIEAPVLWVEGEESRFIHMMRGQPDGYEERLSAFQTLADVVCIEGAGHNVHQDQPEALAQAIEDVIAGRQPALTIEEMNAAIAAVQQRAQEETMANAQAAIEAGNAYRENYANQNGVMRTESGLLYRELAAGAGKKPGPNDTVVVHYRGTLIDGTEFDSSIKRGQPATFSLNGIIPGWQEILQLMPEGARWEVVIPPALAYGSSGAGPTIGPEIGRAHV